MSVDFAQLLEVIWLYDVTVDSREIKKADVMEQLRPSITSAYFLVEPPGTAEMPCNQSSDEFLSLLRNRIELRKLSEV